MSSCFLFSNSNSDKFSFQVNFEGSSDEIQIVFNRFIETDINPNVFS